MTVVQNGSAAEDGKFTSQITSFDGDSVLIREGTGRHVSRTLERGLVKGHGRQRKEMKALHTYA